MTGLHKTTGVARLAALALGALLTLAPVNASALTIGLADLATNTGVIISSGDALDQSTASNEVSINNVTVGESSVTLQLAFFTDTNGRSVLSLTGSATAGSGGLFMDAFHEGFGAGAGSPTFVNFQVEAGSVTGALQSESPGRLQALGYVNKDNNGAVFNLPFGSELVGNDFINNSSDMINQRRSFLLNDPFAMIIQTGLAPNIQLTGLDATLTAAVPLPAAGWLMIAGLGGLAALRRRKRVA